LEERLTRLEDLNEIQNLQGLYARYADRGWPGAGADSAALADLFTEDGVLSLSPTSTLEGRAAIRDGLGKGNAPLAVHLVFSPVIDVEGDEAKGSWRAMFALTRPNNVAMLGCGGYEVRYRRTASGWRIQRLDAMLAFMTPYGETWAVAS